MNTKVKIYNIERHWNEEKSDTVVSDQVAVGACPFEVWGNEPDEWTENQTGFDQRIFNFFESLDEMQSYCGSNKTGEWSILSHEFYREADLLKI